MSKWRPYAKQIEALPIDGSIDFDMPNDAAFLRKMRAGMSIVEPLLKFLLRTNPKGGIRAIHVGNWGSAWCGLEEFNSPTEHPLLVQRIPHKLLQALRRGHGTFFLGFMRGSSMHNDEMPRTARCTIRACPFPKSPKAEHCAYHIKSYSMPYSLLGTDIDAEMVFGTEKNPDPVFYSGLEFELRRGDFYFEHKGRRQYDDLWMGRKNRDSMKKGTKGGGKHKRSWRNYY